VRLICFRPAAERDSVSPPRAGALLGNDAHVLDFQAAYEALVSTRLPSPRLGVLDWFDLDRPLWSKARTLHDSIVRDEEALLSVRETGAVLERSQVELLAPVPRPGKVICVGLNYRDHAAEAKMAIPERPVLFSKFSSCVIASGQDVLIPSDSTQVDYEAELAVVIGRRTTRVARDRALDHVLGYVNFNDVSARDFQFGDGQWQRGKSCDTFAPMGEFIVTPDEVGDPHRLRIGLRLNGKTMQDSNTDQLIFDIPTLIEFISRSITLEPGDVIATGTPPGVGFARRPPVFLQPGDFMEVEIERLGVLKNRIAASPARS
jgi:2-keto-4-pentenoate hydratase/2-oxohepta-3-ene-1,7-dioic acid hydratase in catechol pathway